MATLQRDGYKVGDIVVVATDEFWESNPDLTYHNLTASFLQITDFLPDEYIRGRNNTGKYGAASVCDVHMSQVRGQVVVENF